MSKQFLLDQINAYYDQKDQDNLREMEEREAAEWGIQLPQATVYKIANNATPNNAYASHSQEKLPDFASVDEVNSYFDQKDQTKLQEMEEREAAEWGIQSPQPAIVQQMQALDVVQKPLLTQEIVQIIAFSGYIVPEPFSLGSKSIEDFINYCLDNPSSETELMANIATEYLEMQ